MSLANVLYRSGYYDNAATSMQLALEVLLHYNCIYLVNVHLLDFT